MTTTDTTVSPDTPSLFAPDADAAQERLVIEGARVLARSPEGAEAEMPVEAFLARLHRSGPDCGAIVLPNGVRTVRSQGNLTVLVWEIEPRVHHVRWIAKDSPVPFGRGMITDEVLRVKYEERRLAMPYLLVFATFVRRRGRLILSGANEAYFRTRPLTGGTDELLLPALLNISRYPAEVAKDHALAWICTQYLNDARLAATADENERVRASLKALLHTLLGTAFNRSSEHHELESYYTLCARTMPQIADLDEWERLSREDPLWVLDADWPRAELDGGPVTVDGLIERIFRQGGRTSAAPPRDAAGLARLVFNRPGASRRRRAAAAAEQENAE